MFCSPDMSICKAYESAIEDVKRKHGWMEADKFLLLKEIDEFMEENHICSPDNIIFPTLEQGYPEPVGLDPKILKLPSKVVPFIARNIDLFNIMALVQDNATSVLQIFGMPGMGKSAILRNIVIYIAERN